MNLRAVVWLWCAAVATVPAIAQQAPARAPLALKAPVADKNFYVLSLLARTPSVQKALADDAALKQIAEAKQASLHQAAVDCRQDIDCFTAPLRFSDQELTQASTALKELYRQNAAVRRLVDGALQRSGAYVRWHSQNGDDLLASAWMDAARGINRSIEVYGDGKPPRYPAIDSVSFDVKTQAYRQMIHSSIDLMDEKHHESSLFFQVPLQFAIRLLEINHRDEAGRFEPMELGENQAAVHRMASLQWNNYPYTAIVVPGAGSDRTTWTLSGAGHMRCEMAARRYHAKKAPLIVVSGGYVHPNQTPYCEALEMKKALIHDFGVPSAAILIDPHARHTTTNLRNAARLLYRYGVPFDHKSLIVTDRYQSAYIEGDAFRKRCELELGYLPYRILGRSSVFELEFLPMIESLQIDPTDPLDP